MTAARRLAAILAADVVGYSRLTGEDEAGRRWRFWSITKRRGISPEEACEIRIT